ncbi:MAG: 6-phospho-3-hexuloisomerase [Candidatus Burarchaeum sp.]|nr:6-phospho-3-hexuloisomerase [Candidatus Burarchaeum sp.]MDO8339846.1 6-phospho-3-hexuloisomerase [Candidatus Burarchaeum sp.]
MTIHRRMELLTQKLAEQCRQIDRKSIDRFMAAILGAKRIFIHGAGRSGLVGRAFAMRLMHLGFNVYVVGETTTPPIREGDIYIAVSGSGKTSTVLAIAKTVKTLGAQIAIITSHPDSPMGELANLRIVIKGREPTRGGHDYLARQLAGQHEPLTPLGTLFELSAMLFLDSMIEELMIAKNKTEGELKTLHTNLE